MKIEVEFDWDEDTSVGIWGHWNVAAIIEEGNGTRIVIPIEEPTDEPAGEWLIDREGVDRYLDRGPGIHPRYETLTLPGRFTGVNKASEVPEIVEPLQKRWDEIREAERKADEELARAYEEEQEYWAQREANAREDEEMIRADEAGGWAHDDPPLYQ